MLTTILSQVTPSGPVHQCSKPTIDVVEEQLRSKVFTCSYCSRQFFGKDPMRRHATQHRAETTFQCSQCSCYFSSEGRLEEHMTCQHILLDQQVGTYNIMLNFQHFQDSFYLLDFNQNLYGQISNRPLFQNIKQNLHGDIIGVSLEDVLNANDSLATPQNVATPHSVANPNSNHSVATPNANPSLANPNVKTTMRRSSTWSKSGKPVPLSKATTRALARPRRILPKLAPKPTTQQRPKLSITSVKSYCAKNKPQCVPIQSKHHSSIPVQQSKPHSSILVQKSKPHSSILSSDRTFVKLPHPIPVHSLPAASAIVKHCSGTQQSSPTVKPPKDVPSEIPDKRTPSVLKPANPGWKTHNAPATTAPPAPPCVPHLPHWKTHKRSSSEDSLPEEDHPLHKLLVLCRYAKREQTRLETEGTSLVQSNNSQS